MIQNDKLLIGNLKKPETGTLIINPKLDPGTGTDKPLSPQQGDPLYLNVNIYDKKLWLSTKMDFKLLKKYFSTKNFKTTGFIDDCIIYADRKFIEARVIESEKNFDNEFRKLKQESEEIFLDSQKKALEQAQTIKRLDSDLLQLKEEISSLCMAAYPESKCLFDNSNRIGYLKNIQNVLSDKDNRIEQFNKVSMCPINQNLDSDRQK